MEVILAEASGHSSTWIMLLFAAVMFFTYVGVAYEPFHKNVAALCGAAVLTVLALSLGVFGEYGETHVHLAKDLNIFGVIIGTGILVGVTGKSGLFHFLSMLIVRATGGRAVRLYLAICGLTFVFVALLTIVPAILILCSLVLVICRSLNYSPKPFLVSVAISANSGALVTFANRLPNIMIGTAAGIPYVHFLLVAAPYADRFDLVHHRVARTAQESAHSCRLGRVREEGRSSNADAEQIAESLAARSCEKLTGDSYEQILATVEQTGCDLVVVPSPYDRDLEKVGTDSTGTENCKRRRKSTTSRRD